MGRPGGQASVVDRYPGADTTLVAEYKMHNYIVC